MVEGTVVGAARLVGAADAVGVEVFVFGEVRLLDFDIRICENALSLRALGHNLNRCIVKVRLFR